MQHAFSSPESLVSLKRAITDAGLYAPVTKFARSRDRGLSKPCFCQTIREGSACAPRIRAWFSGVRSRPFFVPLVDTRGTDSMCNGRAYYKHPVLGQEKVPLDAVCLQRCRGPVGGDFLVPRRSRGHRSRSLSLGAEALGPRTALQTRPMSETLVSARSVT
jgi:hypothetical protein